MIYDGSVRGTAKNIGAFHRLSDGSLLIVFSANQAIAGLGTATPYDVVKFTPQNPNVFPLGAGAFSWFFQGREPGLTAAGEKLDALDLVGNRLLLSTTAAAKVTLPNGATLSIADEDVFAYDLTAGRWESLLVIDGSVVPGLGAEDINGLCDDPNSGDYYVTILGAFNLGGLKGSGKSIVKLTPNGAGFTPSLVSWTTPPGTIDALHLE